VDVFAEVEPNQKESIILALKQSGHVVGYMGDGINDASALHAADVGISVANGVDVAKEAADIVLLEKDLEVLARGVREGRVTFANTLKYVFMATSANFGNMFSMAGASIFLPFLPLLPKQILLTNMMTDFPEMTIATDSVDPDAVDRPRRWDIKFIRRFMVVFGLVSSIFDYLTFGALLFYLKKTPDMLMTDIVGQNRFQTGWFVESVASASLIVLVIRTRKRFYQSRPGTPLLIATLAIVVFTLLLPYIPPLAALFNFQPLPGDLLLVIGVIIAMYVFTAEAAKAFFYRHFHY
jgi:Mg2+-importing ATPase